MESKVADERNVIVLGSGPAGFTAALYAARADLEPLVLKGLDAGGQLMLTTDVENYPGFADAIMGPELMEQMEKQAARFGAEILPVHVTRVDLSERPFGVWAGDQEWRAGTIVICTGATARWLGVPGEEALRGRGVSACATCDGFFFRDRDLVVVGGGDSAMEEATFLTKFASKVTIVHRRDEFRASKIMQDRVLAHNKIDVLWNTEVREIIGKKETGVEGVRLFNNKTMDEIILPTQGVFIAIGHKPNTELFKGVLEMDPTGYLKTEGRTMKTNISGVFACGDAQDAYYRQAVTAAGTGCMAAIDAERYLAEKLHEAEKNTA